MTSMGQNTGILKHSKNVHVTAINVLFVMLNQNLNSGKRLINGRNSSLLRVGKFGPSSENNVERIIVKLNKSSLKN